MTQHRRPFAERFGILGARRNFIAQATALASDAESRLH